MNLDRHVEDLRTRLCRHRSKYREISELADGRISYHWLTKFGQGNMRNPTVGSLRALESALDKIEARAAA